jgi:hypothetical protein
MENSIELNINSHKENLEINFLLENLRNISIEKSLKETEKENEIEKYSIINIEEYFKLSFKYNKDYNKNIQINYNENEDILIKENFLIAIINLDILAESSQISTVFLNIITKDYWKELNE